MPDISWIKLSTKMFDDEKIRLIDALPERDAIQNIWVRLICLAGRCNDHGAIYLRDDIPYTPKMLSTLFNRPESVVQLALQTFQEFGMIEIQDSKIYLLNWYKHQSIDELEKIRDANRERVRRFREKKALLEEKKEELDKDIDREGNITVTLPYKQIIEYLNSRCNTSYKHTAKATQGYIRARFNEGYRFEDFKKVIDSKFKQWGSDAKMCAYLRPQTLFGTKFEDYLQEHKTCNVTQARGWTCKKCGAVNTHSGTMCIKCREER